MKRTYPLDQGRLLVLGVAVCILLSDLVAQNSSFLGRFQRLGSQPLPSERPLSTPQPALIPSAAEATIQLRSFTPLRTANAAQIAAAQTSFVGAPIATAVSEVVTYQLEYDIRAKNGNWVPVTAHVYLPTTAGKYPLFLFGSGTTGLADKCAPSLENMAVENIGNYDNQMIAQAAEGYVAVLADYEGFHSSEATQAYFIAESEAKVMLGAIQSLLELQPQTLVLQNANLNQVFLAGYSQGGHAALSTATKWEQLPASVKLLGVVQYAGAANVEALFLESPWLASYLVDSYAQYYGAELDPQRVLQDRWLIPLAKNNQDLCVNQAYRYYPHTAAKLYNPAFLDAIETHTWPANLTAWQKKIQLNTPLTNLPDIPYLSVQGQTDPIVTAQTQHANVAQLCQQHKRVNYREYAGVNHFQVRQESFVESNDWMRTVLAGNPPVSDCP